MAFIGKGVTSFPNNGEKLCVSCEYWTGYREITYNGSAATSTSMRAAMCEACRKEVLPNQPCVCASFKKWRLIR